MPTIQERGTRYWDILSLNDGLNSDFDALEEWSLQNKMVKYKENKIYACHW